MKKFLFAVLTVLCLQAAYAQEKATLEKPHVDKRVELISIVFRLAGNPEYSFKAFKPYTDRIEQHFEAYKNHELIQFTKAIVKKRNHGYDSPMFLAAYLDDNLNLLANTNVNRLYQDSPRWTKKDVEKFTLLLQQFAADSKFDDFFDANADLYAEAIKRFVPFYERLDLSWYRTFYGKESSETFSIVIGPGNGMSNYGPSITFTNGSKKVYAIIAVGVDSKRMPEFSMWHSFLLLHEFNHAFVNYMVDKNKKAFKRSGKKLFSMVKNEMARQAYRKWKTMMYEAIVRAAVIKYCKDHNIEQSTVEQLVKDEKFNGFLWIEELVAELDSYDKQRDKYPTLESYMPKLVEAYNGWAEKIQPIDDSKRPVVVSISEFKNGDTNVSEDIKTITVNFSEPLSGKGHSIWVGSKGMDAFPNVTGVRYANSNQSVVMEVSLEKDKEYQFVFIGDKYTAVEGIGIKDYEVNFKTAK